MQWVQENKLYAPEISTNSVRAVLIHSRAEVSIRGMSYASPVKTCVLLRLSPSHSPPPPLYILSVSTSRQSPFPSLRFLPFPYSASARPLDANPEKERELFARSRNEPARRGCRIYAQRQRTR